MKRNCNNIATALKSNTTESIGQSHISFPRNSSLNSITSYPKLTFLNTVRTSQNKTNRLLSPRDSIAASPSYAVAVQKENHKELLEKKRIRGKLLNYLNKRNVIHTDMILPEVKHK
jgi:hypothetical protein